MGGFPPERPLLVFVTGPPGAGKTTLVRALAPRLGLLPIAKDDIKESLSDSLGETGLRWSKKLGAATWDVLWLLIERCAAANASAIFESNFYPKVHRERLLELRRKHPFLAFELQCTADEAVRRKRHAERERHPRPSHLPADHGDGTEQRSRARRARAPVGHDGR